MKRFYFLFLFVSLLITTHLQDLTDAVKEISSKYFHRLEKARAPLKCALCTKLCTRLSRVWAYFKPVARVSSPRIYTDRSGLPASANTRTSLAERLKAGSDRAEASLPSESVQQTVAPPSVSFEERPPPMKLCSIVGDLPIKSNTFGLFSFERVESDN